MLLFALLFAKSFCSAFVCFGCRKRAHNTHLAVWEHVCSRFLLLINIFDVCMMSEVVWKFFFAFVCPIVCYEFFVRRTRRVLFDSCVRDCP